MEKITQIPRLPGIYLFKDHANTVIYIGKAKSLYNRVSSYFHKSEKDWKVKELIKEHKYISYIVTYSEIEALLLEAQLVRQYQPKYNVLLKSGNPFVYLLITDAELPEFKIVRIKKEKGRYIGPFLQKKEARAAFDYLTKAFQLKLCKKNIAHGCLDYHLGKCTGTCLPSFDPAEYRLRVELMYEALVGKRYDDCISALEVQIEQFITDLEFEKAKRLYRYKVDLLSLFATLKAGYSEEKYMPDVIHATIGQASKSSYDPDNALEQLRQLLALDFLPIKVDCFDISHFQSRYIVGSCVRFTKGQPDMDNFRRFKIKTLKQQNDYAALQEVISRRYRYRTVLPDVALIDGGKGQLSAAQAIEPEVLFISLAKREETVFTSLHPEGLKLDPQTDLGRFLMRARDYAHHAAITYHQLLRDKDSTPRSTPRLLP
ncbi:MAG TPA: GIY-YIG nuclease family protein [Candidatus Babeliaceae bacterium]|nr:GIY-YIG nuclease family protein [Candidatus Babeliaceae bacterium]